MKLKTGGILYREEYNSKNENYDLIDVTHEAYAYLHEFVELEDVSIRDIYTLISKHTAIKQILSHNYIEEFLNHIETDPQKENKSTPENPEAEIEFIEIYRNGYYDSELNRLEFDSVPSIHGLSHVLKKQCEHYLPGSRINWSLSFIPLGNILDLYIQVSSMIKCQQENHINHYDFSSTIKFERTRYTLFDILNAVTWELSFHGSPEESKETGDNLKNIVEQINENLDSESNSGEYSEHYEDEQEYEPGENYKKSVSFDEIFSQDELIHGFSFIDSKINKKNLNQLMHYLPNKVDVALFFGTVFPGKVMIQDVYSGLTAYEYRHKIFNADEKLILSKEMKDIISKNQGLRFSQESHIEDRLFELVEEMGSFTNAKQIHELEIF